MRTHDDRPDEAIAQLPTLLASPGLPAASLPRAAWLANHLLGEKRGDWRGAWALLKAMPLADAGPALLRHCVVAATLAGDALAASFDSDLRPWFDDCARRAKREPAVAGS
ncbi:hypothetical protein LQR31_06470 [Chromobacterium vaccinii]|uniref:hypothetical protein n=1 Tax=Chromobacterium vaccinii TaxID=1108595 RepID=UPI001E60C688|nr:hypothetical protein [Chromobacterium vaccinii]MCD4484116.1 hypothetical protein [Chromobacterium vaccinii]